MCFCQFVARREVAKSSLSVTRWFAKDNDGLLTSCLAKAPAEAHPLPLQKARVDGPLRDRVHGNDRT